MFNNSSSHTFGSANFSIVHGNQNNNTYYLQHAHQVPGPREEEWKMKLYREYDRVPAGRIKILKKLTESPIVRHEYEDNSDHLTWEERWDTSRATRATHLACLVNGMEESSPFLSITYTGCDAHKIFKHDCLAFSSIRHANVMPLRGFNDSDIPMVLFHEELIPVKYILEQCWGSPEEAALQNYFSLQACIAMASMPKWCQTKWKSYSCDNVWVHPRSGRISFGPKGPWTDYFRVHGDSEWQLGSCSDMPVLHTSMYNTGCILKYLINCSPDKFLLSSLSWIPYLCVFMYSGKRFPPSPCQVWARSSGRPIARFQSHWMYKAHFSTFSEEYLHPVIMEDGRKRFSIKPAVARWPMKQELLSWFIYEINMSGPYSNNGLDWLFQACSIFSKLNIPKNEWLEYELIKSIDLNLSLDSVDYTVPLQTTCYLFLLPPPQFADGFPDVNTWKSGKDLYYYSLDPYGESVIPESQCLSLGLPFCVTSVSFDGYIWRSTDVYDLMEGWQEKKGFNPTTTDYAHSVGCSILEVIYSNDEEHFEDLSEVLTEDEGAMDIDSLMPASHYQDVNMDMEVD